MHSFSIIDSHNYEESQSSDSEIHVVQLLVSPPFVLYM